MKLIKFEEQTTIIAEKQEEHFDLPTHKYNNE